METVPVIDVRALVDTTSSLVARREVAARMGVACRHNGFFYVTGHGVDVGLQTRLEALAREFFARSEAEKQAVRMALGGRAWRGFFPVGGELTSGRPDRKEGLYFGTELSPEDPRVLAGTPLHGPNLFPREPAGLRGAVLDCMAALTSLGHVFNYPPGPEVDAEGLPVWGVGEHTDYGVLTILKQDDASGLQVKSRQGGQVRWVEAPPVEDAFVCNIWDMLDRMTRGVYRSTPHRVLNRAGRDRLSLPFFFDPGWTAEIHAIDSPVLRDGGQDDHAERWDRQSVHAFRGTYGGYLLGKVGKVFPDLRAEVL